jgi:pimeloyl-ACP methyl ester carboxylesterase
MFLAVAMLNASRPVAVMIHGAGGGGWEWDAWRPVFERAGYRVVAPDLEPTAQGLGATRLEDYETQVVNWSKHDGHFILIGASMGGALAMRVANRLHPDALVLVNAVPPAGLSGEVHPAVVKWAGGPLKDTVDSMPDSDEATIQKAWKRWRDESGAVMDTLAKGYSVQKPTCPVLVILSQGDTDVPPDATRKLAREFGADLIEYAGASHVGPLLGVRAAEVAKTVTDWLSARLAVRSHGTIRHPRM